MENVYYGLAQIFMTDWDKQYMIFQFAIEVPLHTHLHENHVLKHILHFAIWGKYIFTIVDINSTVPITQSD